MTSMPFPKPLTLEQANKLKVNDFVDHQCTGVQYTGVPCVQYKGFVVGAQIVEKNGTELKLTYQGWSYTTGEQFIVYSDYSQCLYKFYPAWSISGRSPESDNEFKQGDFVDVNIMNSGWRVGRISDTYKNQFKISYKDTNNVQKTFYIHPHDPNAFALLGTYTKKRYSETIPLWLKTRNNSKCIPNSSAKKK
eukprot:248257_1